MIAPQELRLGNLVTIDNPDFHKKMKGIPVIVNGINFRIERDFPKSTASISVTDGKSSYDQFNEFISPIELTEEWFKKFGSLPAEAHDFVLMNIFFINFGGFYYRAFLEGKIRIEVELKYVHQLQNLTFALTGEELTIKEQP